MHICPFAPEDYPGIVAVHNDLHIVWPERPKTPEGWAKVDSSRSSQYLYQRWVAVEAGQVVGFASYSHGPMEYPLDSFYINVEVSPAYQRQGIGSALYDQVIEGLNRFHPPSLRADAFTNLPQGFRFLQKRGFYEAFRETPVQLDIKIFDPAPYAGLEPRLKADGILIKTLSELKSDPGRDRKLYELHYQVDEDVPHEGEQVEKPDFDVWLEWGVKSSFVVPDAYFIAVREDEYIGLRVLGTFAGSDTLLGGLLGVRRDYRNRGIGLALQLRGIAYAREHNYRLLKTCTAVQNAPMQALFTKLGYSRDPEWQQCQRDIQWD